jgi:hypothetical protein
VAIQFIESLKFVIAGEIFKVLEVIFFKIARGQLSLPPIEKPLGLA